MSLALYSEGDTRHVVLGGILLPRNSDRRRVKVLNGVQFTLHSGHSLAKVQNQVFTNLPVEWQSGGGFFLELPGSTVVAIHTSMFELFNTFPHGSVSLFSDAHKQGGQIGHGWIPYEKKVDLPGFGFLKGM